MERPNDEWRRARQDFVSNVEPADWVRNIIEFYWQTGSVRSEDLRRLLGDPRRGVEVPAAGYFPFGQAVEMS